MKLNYFVQGVPKYESKLRPRKKYMKYHINFCIPTFGSYWFRFFGTPVKDRYFNFILKEKLISKLIWNTLYAKFHFWDILCSSISLYLFFFFLSLSPLSLSISLSLSLSLSHTLSRCTTTFLPILILFEIEFGGKNNTNHFKCYFKIKRLLAAKFSHRISNSFTPHLLQHKCNSVSQCMSIKE